MIKSKEFNTEYTKIKTDINYRNELLQFFIDKDPYLAKEMTFLTKDNSDLVDYVLCLYSLLKE